MSWKYYLSLLVYSTVKVSSIIVWLLLINKDIIGPPLAFEDFIKPAYAVLVILLLLILPNVPSGSKTIIISMVTLIVGLLIVNLYLTIGSFFPFSSADYKVGGLVLSSIGSVVFCVAIVTLIYESIKSAGYLK